jgi:Na+-translocating ferredoxin:NAD+ oxidoreductase RNF subunit RnfB
VNLSRKQFLRRGLFSIGSTALELAAGLRGEEPAVAAVSPDEVEPELRPRPEMVAVARPGLCLARSCGCFTCIERCEAQAITLVPGKGIEVDSSLCTGCGNCCYLCPTAPKAVVLAPREGLSPP